MRKRSSSTEISSVVARHGVSCDFPAAQSPWSSDGCTGAASVLAKAVSLRTLVQQGLLHPVFPSDLDVDDVDVIIPVHDDVASLRALLASLRRLHVTIVDDGHLTSCPSPNAPRSSRSTWYGLTSIADPGPRATRARTRRRVPSSGFIDVDVVMDNPLDVLARLQATFTTPSRGRSRQGSSVLPASQYVIDSNSASAHSTSAVEAHSWCPRARSATCRVPASSFVEPATAKGSTSRCVLARTLTSCGAFTIGLLVRFVAEVTVAHRARPSWSSWWSQRVRYGQSSSELAKRHGERLAPLRVDAWTLAAWSSVLVGKPVIGLRIMNTARDQLRERLRPTTDDADQVARKLVGRGMLRAGGPLARAVVRQFGAVVMLCALLPKLRRRALLLYAFGTAWRWRSSRVRASDIPLAIADDAAYGVGLLSGAVTSRTLLALTPHITKSTLGLRQVLGLKSGPAKS